MDRYFKGEFSGSSAGADKRVVEKLELRAMEERHSDYGFSSESSSSEGSGSNTEFVDDAEMQIHAPLDYSWVNIKAHGKISEIDPEHPLLDVLVYYLDHRRGEHWWIRGMADKERVFQRTPEKYGFNVYADTLAKIPVRPPFTVFEQFLFV